ncbi:hypothetical protein LXL04_034303 [Taraxacum kok-saghyz]
MASSSGSDLSGSGNRRRHPAGCDCLNPKAPMERVLWSDANLGRRFLNCVDSLMVNATEKCDFFEWTNLYVRKLLKKVDELEKRNAALEDELVVEREANEGMKMKSDQETTRLVKELGVGSVNETKSIHTQKTGPPSPCTCNEQF